VENGMVKCHEYWPERGVGGFGNMVVTTVGEKLFPEFIVRQFTLTMNSKNRKVHLIIHHPCNVHYARRRSFSYASWMDTDGKLQTAYF
jgi:hypothetical protein